MPAIDSNAPPQTKAVFGPVSLVRAVPSRCVSVISIEVPEEMHVTTTNLLYGRSVLLKLAKAAKSSHGAPHGPRPPSVYGVIGASDIQAPTLIEEDRFVHGHAIDVRALRAKGVSVISVEVPEDAHVEVTQMLYGCDVLVVPVDLRDSTPYGVVKGRGQTVHTTNSSAGTAGPQKIQYPTRNSMIQVPRGPAPSEFDPVKWVGAKCNDEIFQEYLGVSTPENAAYEVRRLCEVSSRKELGTDTQARERFMDRIYRPFLAEQSRRPRESQSQ